MRKKVISVMTLGAVLCTIIMCAAFLASIERGILGALIVPGIFENSEISLESVSDTQLKQGLVLYFKFDNQSAYGESDSVVYDFSARQNIGTVLGAHWNPNAGISGGAFIFDGINDYISVRDADSLSPSTTGKFTISLWIKFDRVNFVGEGSTKDYIHFLGKGGGSDNEYMLRQYNHSNSRGRADRLCFYIFNLTGGEGSGSYVQEPISLSGWIFFVGVFNGTDIEVWKNGVFKDTTPLSQFGVHPGNGNAPLNIGTNDGDSYFNGVIDELRIYNRSLNSQEILALYQYNFSLGTPANVTNSSNSSGSNSSGGNSSLPPSNNSSLPGNSTGSPPGNSTGAGNSTWSPPGNSTGNTTSGAGGISPPTTSGGGGGSGGVLGGGFIEGNSSGNSSSQNSSAPARGRGNSGGGGNTGAVVEPLPVEQPSQPEVKKNIESGKKSQEYVPEKTKGVGVPSSRFLVWYLILGITTLLLTIFFIKVKRKIDFNLTLQRYNDFDEPSLRRSRKPYYRGYDGQRSYI